MASLIDGDSSLPATAGAGSPLADAKRVVVKIGSALLVDEKRGEVHRAWLETVAADIAAMKARGQEVVVVTSGSIAVGRRHLGLPRGGLRLEEKQAAAATGQGRLAHAYQETFAGHGMTAAQVLLTIGDTEDRRRYLNARNTMDTLLRYGAVPVVNENDTVATTEIRFGDNDRLAARVGMMIGADALVLLSDIDGLYTADPKTVETAELIPEVRELTPEIEAMAGEARPGVGTGGMVTKLMAARICMGSGTRMAIALGKPQHPLKRLEETGRCTWFLPKDTPRTARKTWIAGRLRPAGTLHVDDGAARALRDGRSLLPAGITAIEGTFERGDAVLIKDYDGAVLGKGLVAYNSHDASLIAGHKTADIFELLGYRGRDEMIHRDDLVLDV
ncbi:Glutamate 5-kinase [Caenispirillum salinarum AK4]|uniref:Glutamate 5-kinase n=1 Tax=Caenispirillum salinarum AK4 TaxID=1238182 RepID=K9HW07_9PROT|nr:glutamate 5-kinase [Caenispirillum salinarum]EKV32416.1 Glutamate 5-kinase [Caenispirillum salinarum AK4]